jgi:hypothetical protein
MGVHLWLDSERCCVAKPLSISLKKYSTLLAMVQQLRFGSTHGIYYLTIMYLRL